MEIRPHGNRLYVIVDRVEERKIGNLYVPDNHSEHSRIATVVAAGEDAKHYKPGDRIVISYYTGIVIDLPELNIIGEGQDVHRIIREDEVLAHAGG